MKILIIEDEVQIRENIQQILELSGFEAYTAYDGKAGLELVKTSPPDLILCDIMMPELDGYDVLSALRQEPATASIPVIFLTAKADRVDLRRGMELGADDYLTKPFETDELLRAISARLERQTMLTQQYTSERQQTKKLRQEILEGHRKLQESQQLADVKTELLQRISQDLRNPLSNINMAIRMLEQAKSDADRSRYLEILQEECAREIELLNEIDYLQTLLTPENTKLLQRFKLLQS